MSRLPKISPCYAAPPPKPPATPKRKPKPQKVVTYPFHPGFSTPRVGARWLIDVDAVKCRSIPSVRQCPCGGDVRRVYKSNARVCHGKERIAACAYHCPICGFGLGVCECAEVAEAYLGEMTERLYPDVDGLPAGADLVLESAAACAASRRWVMDIADRVPKCRILAILRRAEESHAYGAPIGG